MKVTDEVKSRLDIVDVIGGYVQLKKAGRNYKGLCPFHGEKTPSFVVFPDSQNWRCFGCGRGGDVYNFLMEAEGLEFRDALRVLADRAGVQLEQTTPQQAAAREHHDHLLGVLRDAAGFFYQQLTGTDSAEHVREYVAKRGLGYEALNRFSIGYAPNSWDATGNYLRGLGYSQQDLIDAGMLVVKEETGRTYDRFRDRLVIPIRDPRGNVVGFGARGLEPDAIPKYINSPQGDLFDKSRLLYGFSEARRSIREGETAIIVEGYMDVIQAHQAGFGNVVAQMGTALTEEQLKLLAPYANRLILALDSDAAGQMATLRGREVIERVSKSAAEEMREDGSWGFDAAEHDQRATLTMEISAQGFLRYQSRLSFDIRVAVMPPGKDPDDMIRETPDEWVRLIEEALPIVEYVIQVETSDQNLNDPGVKSGIVTRVTPLINEIADPVERTYYRQRLARLLRIDERALLPDQRSVVPKNEKRRYDKNEGKPRQHHGPAPGPSRLEVTMNPTAMRESLCLASMLIYPRLLYTMNRMLASALAEDQGAAQADPGGEHVSYGLLPYLTMHDFTQPDHRAIFAAWETALNQDDMEPLIYLYQVIDPLISPRVDEWLNQPLDRLYRTIVPQADNVLETHIHAEAVRASLDLRERMIDRQIEEVRYLMEDSNDGNDSQSAAAYAGLVSPLILARNHLIQKRKALSGRTLASMEEGRQG